RKRLKAGRGGDVHDSALPPLEHSRQELVRKRHESLHVQPYLTDLAFEGALRKRPVASKSRVVHEKVDLEPFLGHSRREADDRLRVTEVRRLDFCPDASGAKLLGQAVETIGPA